MTFGFSGVDAAGCLAGVVCGATFGSGPNITVRQAGLSFRRRLGFRRLRIEE
jgi:hypothetical protein